MKISTKFAYLLLPLIHLSVSADTIKIAADRWMPVNGDPGSDMPGYMVEISHMIFEKEGHKIDYTPMPWSRALESTRANESQCVYGASRNDEPTFVFPREPLGLSQVGIFALKNSKWELKDASTLQNLKIGVITGYAYDDVIDTYIASHKTSSEKIEFVSSNDALKQNIKKLQMGRLDAVVEVNMVMNYTLQSLNIDKTEIINKGSLHAAMPIYIACNKASAKYVTLIDKAYPALVADGSLEKLAQKYHIEKWW